MSNAKKKQIQRSKLVPGKYWLSSCLDLTEHKVNIVITVFGAMQTFGKTTCPLLKDAREFNMQKQKQKARKKQDKTSKNG